MGDIAIYLRNENVGDIDNLIKYLSTNGYYMFFKMSPSYIKDTYSYIIIDTDSDVVNLKYVEDLKYYIDYYMSDDGQTVSDVFTINEFLKYCFKELINNRSIKRHHDIYNFTC